MTKHRVGVLVGIMASAYLIIAGALPAAAGTSFPFTATYASGPDTITAQHCAPANGGTICTGEAFGMASYSGGWDGTSTYTYRYSVDARGTYHVIITESVTGSVPGCGRGSFTVRTVETIDSSGLASSTFALVAHAGSGDLSAISGHGTGSGAYSVDGTGSGSISGTVACRG
jgi:hypothetical protein